MEKITVTIIVLNEENNIRDCLESVKWADEIIVSDSGSTDRTTDICREYGARVFDDEWLGFGPQKNLCADRAANDWILNVDADERVSPGLAAEITAAVGSVDAAGFFVPRKNYFGKRWIKHCGWYPDYNLRLYRRDRGRFSDSSVHESVSVDGQKVKLNGQLVHHTYKDVSDYLARMQRYSTLAAGELEKKGRRAGLAALVLRPPATFLKMFVLKLGFLDGVDGFILSVLYACYTFAKYAKLRELNAGR